MLGRGEKMMVDLKNITPCLSSTKTGRRKGEGILDHCGRKGNTAEWFEGVFLKGLTRFHVVTPNASGGGVREVSQGRSPQRKRHCPVVCRGDSCGLKCVWG